MMRTRYVVLSLAFLAASALTVACRSNGGECDTCSSDEDCKTGLTCSSFSDGSTRCGSGIGSTTCTTR